MWKNSFGYLALLALVAVPLAACDKSSPTEPPPACTYTLSTSSLSFGAAGGPNSVTVTAASNCAWSAVSDRGWMTITGGASDTGNGVVNINLTPNPDVTARTGTLTVAGLAVAVRQDGAAACAIDISPASASFNKDSATGTFALSAAEHCQWSATSNASWLAVTSGSSGSGNGTVAYSVERNRDVSPRTGTITVGQRTFTVAQAGDTPGCEYSVSPAFLSFGASGGSSAVTVVAASHCAWTAASDQAWLTITGGAGGSGGGTVQIAVASNPAGTARTATVTIAGHAVSVRQDGASVTCQYSVLPGSFVFGASGGSSAVTVVAPSQCTWTAASDQGWVAITSGAGGSGDGVVRISVTANPNETARTATLTIAGQAVSVRQDGLTSCSIDISPSSASFNKDSATGTFAVSAPGHCQWSASSNAAWLTVTSGSPGSGNGTVAYSVARNNDSTTRSASMAVGERTFTVIQLGDTGSCEYSVAPVEFTPCMSVPYSFTTTITTQQGCTWTANPDASWIMVTEGQSGSGTGVISFKVSDNWDAPRQGNVMVRWPTPTAGQNVRVAQAGCRYAVSTAAISIGAVGGPGRFDVYQQSDPLTCGGPLQNGCVWTATADVPWITVTTTMPQFGDNPVSFTVAANDSTSARSGTITVRDKTVLITQAGR